MMISDVPLPKDSGMSMLKKFKKMLAFSRIVWYNGSCVSI